MIDKYLRMNKYIFEYIDKPNLNIKLLSDIHYSILFDASKLNIIEKSIKETETDYIIIAGDLIDSTNVVKNHIKENYILNWLERLGKKYKIFITLGNHDTSKLSKKGWIEDDDYTFWEKVNDLDGVYVSHFINKYEDEKVIIYLNEPDYEYYYGNQNYESIEILINALKSNKKY